MTGASAYKRAPSEETPDRQHYRLEMTPAVGALRRISPDELLLLLLLMIMGVVAVVLVVVVVLFLL